MRYLFKILPLILLVCVPFGEAFATPKFTSVKTGEIISANNLNNALSDGGVIATLEKGDTISPNGFVVTASTPSIIYLSGNNDIVSTAILDGIIRSKDKQAIQSGETFVHNVGSNKTEIYVFDTKHFLESTDLTLPSNTQNKLEKISGTQKKKKFMGLLEGTDATAPSTIEVDNAIASLQNKNITSIRVNNEKLGLPQIRELTLNGIVPLHFLLSWGAEAVDLDLHLTGPQGKNERFHIFYLNKGDLDNDPRALFVEDCISTNCSEIIRVDNFKKGGVYRASVFNFGDQSQTSNNLSTTSNVELKLISGGEIVYKEGDTDIGVDIVGGDVIFKGSPPTNKVGNTWRAIEINPDTNQITPVNEIINSENSRAVE